MPRAAAVEARKDVEMNRERFLELLSAYGADMRRWPEAERTAAQAFAAGAGAEVAAELAEARALDAALDAVVEPMGSHDLLAARILKQAPKPGAGGGFNGRALLALAACAVFGVLLGYGGGRLAPTPAAIEAENEEDYFALAFEAPFDLGEGG